MATSVMRPGVLMGTAGLDVNRLAGLLERLKVECVVVDEDGAFDHCVLRLSSVKRPAVAAFLEYENQGAEPRLACLALRDDRFMPRDGEYPLEWQATLRLEGARRDDPEEIARWVEREFLGGAI